MGHILTIKGLGVFDSEINRKRERDKREREDANPYTEYGVYILYF